MVADQEQMTFYPRPKTRDEAYAWIERNQLLYREHGFRILAIESIVAGFLGYCGIRPLTIEKVEEIEMGGIRGSIAGVEVSLLRRRSRVVISLSLDSGSNGSSRPSTQLTPHPSESPTRSA